MERAVAALLPFLHEWKLSLNPEDLFELAAAVLHHFDSDESFEEIDAAVREQLADYAESMSKLYKDP